MISNFNTAQLERRIEEIIKELLDVENLQAEENLKGIGLDSLNTVNLILIIEDEFKIELLDEDLNPENFINTSAVINLIKKKL